MTAGAAVEVEAWAQARIVPALDRVHLEEGLAPRVEEGLLLGGQAGQRVAGPTPTEVASDVVKFARFMQFLAPPTPAPDTPSIARGRALFAAVGCALCHTPTLMTGDASVGMLANRPARLFSDLALHQMGAGLADDILQGGAQGDEFRTAPLWGLGQRIFFLHDGRTRDLKQAIRAHYSLGNTRFGPSEANAVIQRFAGLSEGQKQDLLNFLRSL